MTPEEKYDGTAEAEAVGRAGEVEEVWSTRADVEGRREWTAGARMKMALNGSEGLESSGMVRGASKDSSWSVLVSLGLLLSLFDSLLVVARQCV